MARPDPAPPGKGKSPGSKGSALPDRIAQLPRDHPERKRYEKGWKAEEIEYADPLAGRKGFSIVAGLDWSTLKPSLILLMVMVLGYFGYHYVTEMEAVRLEVWNTVRSKGWEKEDPIIRRQFEEVDSTYWIPTLEEFLVKARNLIKRPITLELFSTENPGLESYLEYIRTHNLPFVESDAIRWQANRYRLESPKEPLEPASPSPAP